MSKTETRESDSLDVRRIDTRDRIEFHAVECGHGVRRDAEVAFRTMPVADLAAIRDEAIDLGCQQPVMPCIRKMIGAVR